MTKLCLTTNFTGSSEPDLHFLVLDQSDAKSLADLGFSAHALGMDGKPITDWTTGKGVAEHELAGVLNGRSHLILLLPRYVHENAKVKKLAIALGDFSRNVGATFYNPPIEAGSPVADLIEHYGTSLFATLAAQGHLKVSSDAVEETTGGFASDDDPATVLFGLVADNFTLARTADRERLFVLPNEKAKLGARAYEVGSSELKHWMTRTYFQATKRVVPNGAVGSVEATIEGMCSASNYVYKLASRTFQDVSGDIWIDLGTDNNNAVLIKDGDWTLQSSLPYSTGTAFLRNEAVLPIGTPNTVRLTDTRTQLETHLLPYVNASHEDWPLVVAWMVNHLIPSHDSPILMLLATAGSGKSTATSAVKFAVEGGLEMDRVSTFKDNEDDVMVAMSKAQVTMFDNVSKVSAELSDRLCQVVYGTTHQKRKLRTDSEVITLNVKSSLILNGIETGHLRGDLKSRMVPINLNSGLLAQMGGRELKTKIVDAHPSIYGSMLTLVANVLPLLDQAPAFASEGSQGLRMQDYARVLWALDHLWGTKGLSTYVTALNGMSEDLLDDPFLLAVASLVRQHGSYNSEDGSYTGLIGTKEMLTRYQASTMSERIQDALGNRPTINAQGIGGKLTRAENEWSRLGVKIKKESRTTIRGEQQVTYWFRIDNQGLMDQAARVSVGV
ncbi:hypothetical protein ACFY5D_16740 [Paeniglutamicibacter sp. NPDC012692]|uniref:hypothetical protein n=1 Tax=Paeniglutamicibacter sp. NPDC012692 TaxID=3364388 RepID=UPI0036C366EB